MKRSLVLLLALGACVSPPKRVAVPPPIVRPAPQPLPAPPPVAWEDRARTAGGWTWRQGRADFAAATGETVSLICSAGNLVLSRSGAIGGLTVRTTTLSRSLRAGEALGANDPLLDAIVFSRGKWMITAPGLPDLILPPWPEIARVVEDCRG